MISVNQRTTSRFHVFRGTGVLHGPVKPFQSNQNLDWKRDLTVHAEGDVATVTLTIMNVERKLRHEPVDVDGETGAVRAEWERFLARMPPAPEGRYDFAVATWYTLWSCFVRARDHYRYDAMLMSKKFMSSVWTWDHCFNALAMMKVSRRTALEQFLLPFELQAESGTLFDMTNPNQEVIWAVTKPPIHGWCFGRMMDAFDFGPRSWRRCWVALPRGRTGGWTTGTPTATASPSTRRGATAAGTTRRCSTTASSWSRLTCRRSWCCRCAPARGSPSGSAERRRRTGGGAPRRSCWSGSTTTVGWAVGSSPGGRGAHAYDPEPTSLLALMPIALGEHLDPDRMEVLAGILEDRFLTEHGPATEAPDSPRYESDGYWRGPIWAPSTYLIVDGLRRAGRDDLARRIAASFCRMAEHKAQGQYENFDALTGVGLRAPGYTWTASVFMLLTWEHLQDG